MTTEELVASLDRDRSEALYWMVQITALLKGSEDSPLPDADIARMNRNILHVMGGVGAAAGSIGVAALAEVGLTTHTADSVGTWLQQLLLSTNITSSIVVHPLIFSTILGTTLFTIAAQYLKDHHSKSVFNFVHNTLSEAQVAQRKAVERNLLLFSSALREQLKAEKAADAFRNSAISGLETKYHGDAMGLLCDLMLTPPPRPGYRSPVNARVETQNAAEDEALSDLIAESAEAALRLGRGR